jgi:WD40 repeat protein
MVFCQLRLTEGHSDSVLALEITSDFLFSSDSNGIIIRWFISNGTLSKVLGGHSQGAYSLLIVDDSLISAGWLDYKIKKWNIGTGELIQTVQAFSTIHSLGYYEQVLFVGIKFNSFAKFVFESLTLTETVKG